MKKKLSVSNEYLTMQKIKISNFRNEKKIKIFYFLLRAFLKLKGNIFATAETYMVEVVPLYLYVVYLIT